MKATRFTGQYAEDGKERRRNVRAEAGHRCIRCGHPFESGKHGKGEWSPCDEKCVHWNPLKLTRIKDFPTGSEFTAFQSIKTAGGLVLSGVYLVEAQWRVLTVHHLDGQKDNDAWWNTLALCQRCHLQVQTKVDPRVPYFLEHSDWFKPFVAGYYAKKYEGADLTRAEVEARLDGLLAYELNGGIAATEAK